MWQRSGEALRTIAIPFFSFFVVVLFDPLGLYTATYAASRDLAFRVLSLWRDDNAARAVAIVLLDDHSADEINGALGYPITFRNHGEIVGSILCRGPTSLFIDFNFRNLRTRDINALVERNGRMISSDLGQMIDDLKTRPSASSKICPPLVLDNENAISMASKVFVARTRSTSQDGCDALFEDQNGILPDRCKASRQIADLREAAVPLTLARHSDPNIYLVAVRPSETFAHPPADADQRFPIEPSPALAAVLAHCNALPAGRAAMFKGCRDATKLENLSKNLHTNRRLVPLWSYFSVKPSKAPLPNTCSPEQNGSTSRALLVLYETAHTLIRGILDPLISNFGSSLCIPYETATVSQYQSYLSHCGAMPVDECRMAQARAVAGRMVFYGASVSSVHDEVMSPVLGNVPGVAVHAAVAANLLEFGADYVREPPLAVWVYTWSQILEVVVVFVWLFALALLSNKPALRCEAKQRLVMGSVGLVLALSVTSAIYVFWNWSPGNWLALWMLFAATKPDGKTAQN